MPTENELNMMFAKMNLQSEVDSLIAENAALKQALEACIKHMEANKPKKAKRGDLDATYTNAIFYRDLQVARNLLWRPE